MLTSRTDVYVDKKVEVRWKGIYWPAKITALKGGPKRPAVVVHYIDYGPGWDETVQLRTQRVREPIGSDALEAERLDTQGINVGRLPDGCYEVEAIVDARRLKKSMRYTRCTGEATHPQLTSGKKIVMSQMISSQTGRGGSGALPRRRAASARSGVRRPSRTSTPYPRSHPR